MFVIINLPWVKHSGKEGPGHGVSNLRKHHNGGFVVLVLCARPAAEDSQPSLTTQVLHVANSSSWCGCRQEEIPKPALVEE